MNQLRLVLRQESMLTLRYCEVTADECVTIACNSIGAIRTYCSSVVHAPTDRFSSVLYIVVALLSLVCVIIKTDNPQLLRARAIDTFKIGINFLRELAPTYSTSRHALRYSHRVWESAEQAIDKFERPDYLELGFHPSDADPNTPHIDDIFMNPGKAHGDKRVPNPNFHQPLTHSINPMTMADLEFPTTINEMDAFWMDEDIFNNRRMPFSCRYSSVTTWQGYWLTSPFAVMPTFPLRGEQ